MELAPRNLLKAIRNPIQCTQARHEEVLTAAKHVESLDAADEVPDRLSWNGEARSLFLQSDDWVTLVTEAHEITVVDPLLLQEFNRGHRLGADEKKNRSARHFIICLGQSIWIVRWSVRGAAPYESMQVDVGQSSELCVARIHAPNVASARSLPATRVVRVVEVIIPLRVRTE